MPRHPARRATGRPARRDALPAPAAAGSGPDGPSPVQVRLIGHDTAVRHLVAALQNAAHCGPATYRPTRDGQGTRVYLDIVVPAPPTDEGITS
ncbi:hypothetical protein ACQEV4_42650 [Streptomyces shenzhenensis]|uniref:hypothetical protein n=1 Tax=Streptomyces shenzhenensis TaxID=943815 RepID=UPI003D93278C